MFADMTLTPPSPNCSLGQVTSVVSDILMPPIGLVLGGVEHLVETSRRPIALTQIRLLPTLG